MTINVGTVAMIPLSSITCSDRAREQMGDLDSLESSMKKDGLAQPLAVKDIGEGKYELLAGGRRYAILSRNNIDIVSARIYSNDLTTSQMLSIELAENFYRKDFEFYEYDALVKRIHSLHQEELGKKISTAQDAEGWGMKDTGELMGITKASVSTAIKRAEAREIFPELFDKCKTQKDASKVLDKLNESIIKEAIAKKLECNANANPDTTLLKLANSYQLKDCLEGMKDIPNEIMHMVEIDPPYGISLDRAKLVSMGGVLDDYNEVEASDWITFMHAVLTQAYRVMTEHSWLVCWFAPEPWAEPLYQLITKAGFTTTRMYGCWTKNVSGQNLSPATKLSNSYELFYYAWKGQPALAKAARSNRFDFPVVPHQQKTHPTERPLDMMKEIYSTFTWPGSRILIPFLGSGSGLIAAHELGMVAQGFELSKEYRDSFLLRIHAMYGGA